MTSTDAGSARRVIGLFATRGMLACMRSATVFGIEADDVFVEVDVAPDLPSFTIVNMEYLYSGQDLGATDTRFST